MRGEGYAVKLVPPGRTVGNSGVVCCTQAVNASRVGIMSEDIEACLGKIMDVIAFVGWGSRYDAVEVRFAIRQR